MKPAPWAWTSALVAPEWQWALKDLVLAVPMWEGQSQSVFDVVNSVLYPITGGGWLSDGRGVAQNFSNGAHGISLGSPTYLNLLDPLTFIYAGQMDMVSGTRHITGFYESGGAFAGWAAAVRAAGDTMQFWEGTAWRDSLIAVSGGFQVLGYTHTGSTVEFYQDGVNVASIGASAIDSYTGVKTLFVQSDFTDSIRDIASVCYIWKRTLTDTEHAQIAKDPYGPLRMIGDVGVVIIPAVAGVVGLPWIRRRRR